MITGFNQKILIVTGILLTLVLYNTLFIVQQTQQAIVLQFGKPVMFKDGDKEVSYISTPGLKVKLPFIQEVLFFDNRVLNFTASDKELLDAEKKTLTVNAFAKYKITDPLMFYTKVINQQGINTFMDLIFETSLRDTIGSIKLSQLLSEERKTIMASVKESIRKKAADFGIQVFDVRIVRADLPRENSEALFKRMQAEREKEAREYRAQGDEEAQIIRSKADKEVKVLIAEANKKSQITKGEGDAIASRIFADAFNQDPEFYHFFRSMEAYRNSMGKNNTTYVLSPESDFLHYFDSVQKP